MNGRSLRSSTSAPSTAVNSSASVVVAAMATRRVAQQRHATLGDHALGLFGDDAEMPQTVPLSSVTGLYENVW